MTGMERGMEGGKGRKRGNKEVLDGGGDKDGRQHDMGVGEVGRIEERWENGL